MAPGRELQHDLTCDAATGVSRLLAGGQQVATWSSPIDALSWLGGEGSAALAPGERWVGYLSYDLGRSFERLPSRAADDLHLPLFRFIRQPGRQFELDVLPDIAPPPPPPAAEIRSTFSRDAYVAAVRRAWEYIAAGDVFQVNLSQRITLPCKATKPQSLFHRVAREHPAAFGALLNFGDYALVSNSPELFFRVEPLPDGRRRIINRPIKGTRPTGLGMERELSESEKEKAELAMIVDLQRNDLGRVCEIGSVEVTEARTIEVHPTVLHAVATVEGILRPDVGLAELLAAVFPCGSVTGCPKIRAMEIIDELEPVRRGPYCGAIGWLGADGAMEFSVAIRTMIVKDGLVHVPVGGGIVADSSPWAEYEETLVKARAMLGALGVAVEDVRGAASAE
jgi:para-aminobenzoate synthetase component I